MIEVDIDKNRVRESHDHSEAFFQCKAYIHSGDIELKGNENVWGWVLSLTGSMSSSGRSSSDINKRENVEVTENERREYQEIL